ncbi:MAG: biopolymer transporter ExbD [Shimia sp.]|nr:biopolymer transporter ExbD [Shimia sp.]
MDFDASPRKPRAESIVPMINVVFLLLIFFLMTAQIAPPEPFEVSPPTAEKAAEPDGELILYVGKESALQFQDTAGEAAFTAIAAAAGDGQALQLRIDASLDGDRLAQIMQRLSAVGFSRVEVIVQAP